MKINTLKNSTNILGYSFLGLSLFMVGALLWVSFPGWTLLNFSARANFSLQHESYGVLPMIFASLFTSLGATLLAVPIAILCTLFLEYGMPHSHKNLWFAPIEILAGIPTVLFGVFGVNQLAPYLATIFEPMGGMHTFHLGLGIIVLGLLLVPFACVQTREALNRITANEKNAAQTLGLSRPQMLENLIWPKLKSQMRNIGFAAWSRGIGEAVVLSLLIGRFDGPLHFRLSSILEPGQTLATKLASPDLFLSWQRTDQRAVMFSLCILLVLMVIVGTFISKWKSAK